MCGFKALHSLSLKVSFMNSCKINNVQPLPLQQNQSRFFKNKVFLFLLNVDRVPPHLGLMIGDNGYSLSIYGPKVKWELSEIIRLVSVKKIKSLFVELDLGKNKNWSWEDLNAIATKHTIANSSVDAKKVTCLYPLKYFCSDLYAMDCKSVNFIFELIPKLYSIQAVKNVYHMNVELEKSDGSFHLPVYSLSDVFNYIDQQTVKLG